MSKLFSAAGTILPVALLLGGCGFESQDLSARDSQALSTLTQSAPAQGQVATSGKVVFSGRSSAASGSAVKVSAIDARLVVHTCPATVRSDQTWSCTQRLADDRSDAFSDQGFLSRRDRDRVGVLGGWALLPGQWRGRGQAPGRRLRRRGR